MGSHWVASLAAFVLCLVPVKGKADQALVAVATNFAEAAETLVREFANGSKHRITVASGSTGKLYAQIVNGAPFDALLAADARRPGILVESGYAEETSRFTYALGRLTLWSPSVDAVDADGRKTLRRGEFRSLAIANPSLAPYGVAATETLRALGLWDKLEEKLVMGENVGQAYALVATGNAELGLVARSSVLSPRSEIEGSSWDVPAEMHAAIRQDAVLLRRGAENSAAREFLRYLRSDGARAIIRSFGYEVE
jgi:molybdate transport system substrate-binding protein